MLRTNPISLLIASIVAALALASCASNSIVEGPDRGTATTTSTSPPFLSVPLLLGFELKTVAVNLEDPVAITSAPALGETFIVERVGRLVTASSRGKRVVLDITQHVGWDINEQGFLGFAVHPDFPADPRGFAVYTDASLDVVVASFDWDGAMFDVDTKSPLLDVPQPHKYHQGGGIEFGPLGYLWMSFGDGGGVGDPYKNGQDPHTRNGTLLRIDVNHGHPYSIPPTNPFADDENGDHAVWAFGLRNPWRFTHDSGYVIVADVGQDTSEEINVVHIDDPGANFGWSITEGIECFDAEPCDTQNLTLPRVIIGRFQTCAIVGGPVYRGADIPELYGHYLFGDFCTGRLRSMPFDAGEFGEIFEWTDMVGDLGQITTFGVSHEGDILIANLDGTVSQIVPIRSSA
jgi:glucose/arabinose dehydrogenase